jgi:anti-sigma regulatory factor (Ser/Thr protein kinase)
MKGQEEIHSKTGFASAGERAMLRHELGNVLNGLLGMTELLLGDHPRRDQERWLRAIEQSGLQMRRLIDLFSSMEPMADEESPVDGIALLEDTIISHAPAARRNKNRLLLLVEPDLPRHWHCDPCRLRQILDNLLANAIHFTGSGDVTVEVVAEGSMLNLKVKDSGAGIRPGAERLLFRPFNRDLHADGGASSGSGMGLYVCRLNAGAMRGRIRWAKRHSGGSTFELRLPQVLRCSTRRRPFGPHAWLRDVRCELKLEGQLRRSVRCFLVRMGVDCEGRKARHGSDQQALPVIAISEVPGGVKGSGLLQLCLAGQGGRSPVLKRLAAPILESGLAALLMEMALEWRADGVSANDNRD